MNKKLRKKLMGISFLAMLLVSAGAVNAQDSNNGILEKSTVFGIKGGVNLSQFYLDQPDVQGNWKVGLSAGIFLRAQVNNLFAIQPELLYNTIGSKLKYGQNQQNARPGEIRYNMNYLQLPVLANLTVGPISIQAGPYAAYLLSANVSNINIDDPLNPNEVVELNTGNFNRIDYGVAAGAAFDFNKFIIGARYNYGLRRITESGNIANQFAGNSKNSFAQAFIAIGF